MCVCVVCVCVCVCVCVYLYLYLVCVCGLFPCSQVAKAIHEIAVRGRTNGNMTLIMNCVKRQIGVALWLGLILVRECVRACVQERERARERVGESRKCLWLVKCNAGY